MTAEFSSNSNGISVDQRIERAVSAFERHDYEGALDDLKEILDHRPTFPDVWNKAGLCLAMLGKLEEALEHLDRAVDIAPDYAEAHLNRAIVLNTLGRFTDAEDAFARASSLDQLSEGMVPSEVGNQIAILHAKLGDLYRVADRTWEAVREYRQALEVRPRFQDIRAKHAEALIELDELEEAHEELQHIVSERPEFAAAHLSLGVVLRRMGREKEAASAWRRCLELKPDDRRARAYLASLGEG